MHSVDVNSTINGCTHTFLIKRMKPCGMICNDRKKTAKVESESKKSYFVARQRSKFKCTYHKEVAMQLGSGSFKRERENSR